MNRPALRFLGGCFAGLTIFGLIAVASASSVLGTAKFANPFYFFIHQLLYGLLPGLVGFSAARLIPLNWVQRMAPLFYILSIILLGLVFVPGLNYTYGGASRWLDLGLFSVQPAEIAKIGLVIFLASWLARKGAQRLTAFKTGVLPFLVLAGVPALMILLQPDVGTTLVMSATLGLMYFWAGARLKHLALVLGVGIIVVGGIVAWSPARLDRLTTFFNPQHDTQDIGYQVNQSLIAIGSGGVFGRGLGQSRQKYSYLPEPAGDTIFAIIAEELGFIAVFGLIFIYLAIAYLGAKIAATVSNDFNKLLILGIISTITIQAFVNMMAVTALLPFTGIPLPLISYGGTALAITLTAIGLLFSATSQSIKRRHS